MKVPVYRHLYCHTIYMPLYLPRPPDYITIHEEVLGSSVLCTALPTLTSSPPAPPQLVCNKTSVGQIHYCLGLKHIIQEQYCRRFLGVPK